jgi:hypothetical protein
MRYGHYSTTRRCRACCNRAATGAGHTRTGQENNSAKNTENRLYKRYFRQGRTYPDSVDLTYKEEVAGSNPASPTWESGVLQEEHR